MYRQIILFAASFALAGCASQAPLGGAPNVSVVQTEILPIPGMSDQTLSVDATLIRPMDVIEIEVFGVPELTRAVQVSGSGNLDFPLIGSVAAVGRTTEELSFELESRLRESYVRDPDVSTRITDRSDLLFTIGGEVSRPGRFPIAEPITLLEAVAIGGGLGEYADNQDVLVYRTVGEDRYIGVYNLEGIQRGNYADPTIYPSDIVMVGENDGRRRLETAIGLVSAITSPLVLLERVLN